jgi:hypothetical protein
MADLLNKFSTLYELAKTYNNAELLKEISDLNMDISGLNNENRELKEKIRLLQFNKDNPLEFRDGMYYAPGDDNPYCVRCYDADGKRIRLVRGINFVHLHTHVCLQCKSEHRPDEYRLT